MDFNWTYEETRKTVLTAITVEGKDSVSLDVSRADWRNVQDIVRWARELGYDATADDQSETVTVRKKEPDGTGPDCMEYAARAIDARNELLDAYLGQTDDEFETTIRIAMQRAARAQRDVRPGKEYWTGYGQGYVDALTALFRERLAQKAIKKMVDDSLADDPAIETAMRYLYERQISQPHPEMAEALSVTYRHLTDTMMPILAVHAADASRTGPATRYSLTPAGRRFCRDVLMADAQD